MVPLFVNKRPSTNHIVILVALLAVLGTQVSCKQQAPSASQKTFASPDDAGTAILEAARSGDQGELSAIFGPDSSQVLSSGDTVMDNAARQSFVTNYDRMHRWIAIQSGGQALAYGVDSLIFPIPLRKNPSGQWYFDTATGKEEILARRIGRDELTAIAAIGAVADAQKLYYSGKHPDLPGKQYAQKLVSDPGKQNGLYWPVADGETPSPLGPFADFARAAGYTNSGASPQPFNGYFYRILTKQGDKANGGARDYIVNGGMTGGFAILAYPAAYGNSGIMTFIISKDGVVYQKDLGDTTAVAAAALTEYNPADGWDPVS